MLASSPASTLNQSPTDLGIPNRFTLKSSRFSEEGSRPFSYMQTRTGKVVTVNSFWRLPERLYDDPDELAAWTRAAVAVAQRQKLAERARAKMPASRRAETGKRKRTKKKLTKKRR